MNINSMLCKECRRKVKAAKRAEKAKRKLTTKKDATYEQKQSWKYLIGQGMRLNPTPAEKKLQAELKAEQVKHGWNLSFQRLVGPYIADCCITNRKCVIEADGAVHDSMKAYDEARDRYMREKGYTVLRYSNEAILTNWASVLAEIVAVVG